MTERRITQLAPDAGDSGGIPCICLRCEIFCFDGVPPPAPARVAQTVSLLREVNMGFVKKYWQEAEEKKLPHWHKCAIVELVTGEARVQVRGFENIPLGFLPECPKTFATYEDAFAWLERKLTMRAMDAWDSPAQLALFSPEVLSTASAESQPAMRH